jgi:hypothetical protein
LTPVTPVAGTLKTCTSGTTTKLYIYSNGAWVIVGLQT